MKGKGPMSESSKLNMVYRLRPVKILPGVHYKITRQRGAEITLEIVPTDNGIIAKRLAQLRYPELYAVMQVMIETLCDTLGDEICINKDGSEKKRRVSIELSRVITCLQGASTHLLALDNLTREDISSHEKKTRPI